MSPSLTRDERLLASLGGQVWAMQRSALDRLAARIRMGDHVPIPPHADLFDAAPPEMLDRIEAKVRYFDDEGAAYDPNAEMVSDGRRAVVKPGPKQGAVAVIPVRGPIVRRDSFFTLIFGGTSTERLIQSVRQLAGDDTIGTIVLDIDSPGGTVSGLPELAAEIRKAAAVKSVIAIANDLAASAAYWIASQADEIVATPEALTGSVGVFTIHEDWSKFWEQAGVAITYVHAGKYKVEGNYDEPLTPEGVAHLQAIVDDAYRLFIEDVAAGRKVQASKVRSDYGEGRVFTSRDAKAAGLIDRIGSFGETVSRLAGQRGSVAKAEGGIEVQAVVEVPVPEPKPPEPPDEDKARAARLRSRHWQVTSL